MGSGFFADIADSVKLILGYKGRIQFKKVRIFVLFLHGFHPSFFDCQRQVNHDFY